MNGRSEIVDNTTGTPTFTAEQIVDKTIANLECQVTELEREQIRIAGKLEALNSVVANLKYMKNHRS